MSSPEPPGRHKKARVDVDQSWNSHENDSSAEEKIGSSLTIDSLPNEIYDRIALFLPAFKFRKLQTVSRRWRFCTTFSFAVRYVLIHQNHLSVDFFDVHFCLPVFNAALMKVCGCESFFPLSPEYLESFYTHLYEYDFNVTVSIPNHRKASFIILIQNGGPVDESLNYLDGLSNLTGMNILHLHPSAKTSLMPSDSEESDLGATRVLWNALLILAACLNSVDDLAELSKWFPLTADDIDDALKFAVTHESLEAVKLLLDLEIENNMDPVIHYEYVDDKRFINSLTHDGRPKMKELSFIDETIKRQSMSLLVYLTDRLSIRPVDYILANHREVGLKMIMSPNYPKELRDASIGGIIEFFDKVNELEGFGSPRYGQDDDDDDCKSYRQRTLRFLRKAVYNIGNLIEQGLYDPSLHDHACLRLAAVVDDTFISPMLQDNKTDPSANDYAAVKEAFKYSSNRAITLLLDSDHVCVMSLADWHFLRSIVVHSSSRLCLLLLHPKLRNPEVFKDFTERVLFTDPHRESRTQGHEPNRFVWIRRFLSNVDGISLQEFYDLLKLVTRKISKNDIVDSYEKDKVDAAIIFIQEFNQSHFDYSRIKEDIDLISDLLMLVIRHRHTATTEQFFKSCAGHCCLTVAHLIEVLSCNDASCMELILNEFSVNGVLVNVKDLDRHTAPLLLYKAFGRGLWEMVELFLGNGMWKSHVVTFEEDLKNSADTMMAVETGLGRYGEDQLPLLRGILERCKIARNREDGSCI